jgi:hypothetical protein
MYDPHITRQVEKIYKRLDRIDKKLNTLLQDNRKQLWVKYSFIIQATGWSKEMLRRAREQMVVKYERRVDGMWYDLYSIPQMFIKNNLLTKKEANETDQNKL